MTTSNINTPEKAKEFLEDLRKVLSPDTPTPQCDELREKLQRMVGKIMVSDHVEQWMILAKQLECRLNKIISAKPVITSRPASTPTPYWYPLFEHMSKEHGLTLVDSELDEIARKVDECRKLENIAQPERCPICGGTLFARGYLESVLGYGAGPNYSECLDCGERIQHE